jgi:hypothetical protein
VKQESTNSTTLVSQCTTRLLLFHSVLPVDSCFTVSYPLTLVSQCTIRWLLFRSILLVDSSFTVYYPLTLVSQCTTLSMSSTMWNKSQRVEQYETRVNGKYNVKQESTGSTLWMTLVSQCTTCWLLFHSVLPVDSCFTVYYPLTLVSQCTTRWVNG